MNGLLKRENVPNIYIVNNVQIHRLKDAKKIFNSNFINDNAIFSLLHYFTSSSKHILNKMLQKMTHVRKNMD